MHLKTHSVVNFIVLQCYVILVYIIPAMIYECYKGLPVSVMTHHFFKTIFSAFVPFCAPMSFLRSPTVSLGLHLTRTTTIRHIAKIIQIKRRTFASKSIVSNDLSNVKTRCRAREMTQPYLNQRNPSRLRLYNFLRLGVHSRNSFCWFSLRFGRPLSPRGATTSRASSSVFVWPFRSVWAATPRTNPPGSTWTSAPASPSIPVCSDWAATAITPSAP